MRRGPYTEVYSVVQGAIDQEDFFQDHVDAEEWIRERAAEADADGLTTEVYTIRHDHDIETECECVQYLTSHKPDYTFPEDDAPEEPC